MKNKLTICVCSLLALISTLSLRAGDWPQWRGPDRNGISLEKGLLKHWPSEGPRLLWQVNDLGAGYSTPAVAGDRLYVMGNEGLENEFVQARAATDGRKIWTTRLGKVGNPDQKPSFPAARSTPTVDGDLLFALGSDGDLACLKADSGKVVWQKNLRKDFGGQPGVWAYAESPLVDGETLICTPGGTDATLLALNKKSGELIWKCALSEGDQASYASALVTTVNGTRQYVQLVQKGLVGVDAKTGTLLWRYDRTAQNSPAVIPTAVVEDGYIYSAGARVGGGLIQLEADAGSVKVTPLYFSPKLPTGIGGSVKVGDYLYGTTGQALLCVHFKTGEVKWEERSIAPASLCSADDRLYLHGENGELALVEPTPEAYREHGRFTPPNLPERANQMEKAWTYPVVSAGRLYLRDADRLWCYDVRQTATR